ncbi:Kinase superfamily protein, putative [Theobroma cacao]|uniref:non-specific serine/threonine protein kinase n=1 Tax=Theobroma cacao TaxID=3641 RepID=A0A061FVH5_THECC|nr:Kinase superfamily protein, putative [Theobroma cacao]
MINLSMLHMIMCSLLAEETSFSDLSAYKFIEISVWLLRLIISFNIYLLYQFFSLENFKMNSQLMLSTPSIFIFTFFLIGLFSLPISFCQDDENFEQCFSRFDCGDIKNLTYPYWTDDRPQLCKQEGFRLTKCEDEKPVIHIGRYEFRMVYLNHFTYAMTISRNDLWEKICPENPINVTLENPFLRYSPTNRHLTFFYNCNLSIQPSPNPFRCTEDLYSFYADDLVERARYGDLSDSCDTAIQVQVNQSAFAELQNQTPQRLEAWKLGFDVVYNLAEILCSACNNSRRGKCEILSSQYPICNNPDDVHFTSCPHPFDCGNLGNLSYPFSTDDRPAYCGYDHEVYKLKCIPNQPPYITISSQEFQVVHLNQAHGLMTIQRVESEENTCPEEIFTYNVFNYSDTAANITLLYGCPRRGFADNSFTCKKDQSETFAVFGNNDEYHCRGKVVEVPVEKKARDELIRGTRALDKTLFEPFEMRYFAYDHYCRQCKNSGGRCGSNKTLTAVFLCYCRDHPYPIKCERATETLSADWHFEACMPRSCGNGPNISYPFWISEEQESYCGYPNFEITCEEKNPVLAISEDSFIIKDIFYNNNSLLVVTAAVSEDDCPTPRQNLSLDRTPFSLNLVNVNLSFLYNCEKRPEYHTYPVSCASNASFHSFAVFHKEGLEKTNYSLDSCQSLIDAPVYINDDVDFASLLEMNYTQVLSMGFVLNWTAHSCSNCKRSGGRCGFDNTSEFVCFCSDGSHPKTCNDGGGINWKAKLGIGFGALVGGIIITSIGFFCWQRRHRGKVFFKSSFVSGKSSSDRSVMMDAEKGDSLAGVHLFSYEELEKATNKFDSDRELGDGGFGTVYYGKLRDGRAVAVKRLYENNYRRVEQFMNEVEILTRLRHKNLVSLYGCTSRHSRELLLVYEYIPNGTVADHLHGERAKPGALPWSIRLEIAIETAEALRFLHASDTIHRDVKTNNILLDSNFSVKVADFGLSRLFPTDVTHVSTAPRGLRVMSIQNITSAITLLTRVMSLALGLYWSS